MEMSWIQILVIAFGNIAWMLPVFFWVRSESRADARHFDQETKELRREMVDVMRGFQSSIDAMKEEGKIFREQWAFESRDFHGRLCTIEERRK